LIKFITLMKKSKLAILLPLLLLLGCSGSSRDETLERNEPEAFAVSTPTLRPGLPTSTPFDTRAEQVAQAEADQTTPVNPITAPPPATATPIVAQRLELGREQLEIEDFGAAAEQYEASLQSGQINEIQKQEALFALGQARLALGDTSAATEAFSQYLAATTSNDLQGMVAQGNRLPEEQDSSDAYFFLAESYLEAGDCAAAIGAFGSYLAANPEMAAYIQPRVAQCEFALGNRDGAVQAYEAAVAGEVELLTEVNLRLRLAQAYVEDGNFPAALEQYDAILAKAKTDFTRGEALYLAGQSEKLAGNLDAAYERYREAIFEHPRAYESFLALAELLEDGQSVDEFQRGLVDYHAKSFEAAVTVFSNYMDSNQSHNEDAHLYLAWSLEGLGNYEAALAQIEAFIDANSEDSSEMPVAAAQGWIELAKMQTRAGLYSEAISSYLTYLERFPEGADGAHAAWWAAALSEQQGESALAVERYENLAALFPLHENAPESLFRAGLISYQLGKLEDAYAYWQEAVSSYPDRRFGAASLIWLMNNQPEEELDPFIAEINPILIEDYYSVRSHHLISGTAPFERSGDIELAFNIADQEDAERWLREQLALEDSVDVRSMSDELANDGRLIRGEKLWHLGLKQDAKRELESLRMAYVDDPVASYQLALYFQDLGLYRSSILAATSVMHLFGVDVFGAPKYIGGLAYPPYFSDLILNESETYGYDPLLQFALIRQESLFESFATSSAVAQGLSQVIPDTGAFIAQRLEWPNYKNEDLYRPHVGIAFGAYYLSLQLEAFDGDVAAALSAYNAGPGNAARWYEQAGGDIDNYVATVDFSETRQYIERIYTGFAVYDYLYSSDEGE
jgi:soluble lytic murein transglycosylase